ncbi:MAG: sulfotransferase [Deltaproteobacteria bacterium]|jgi:hypothetical protein|nr:sulfotransferase [Deltaproteobacteria bacterium]
MEDLPPDLPFTEAREHLIDMARRLAGYDDLGDESDLEGLDVLLESLETEADLSRLGRTSAVSNIVTALVGRLESQRSLAENPGYREVPFEAPIIIIGLARSGTTALHRMLASAEGVQAPELWLLQSPIPRPPRESWPRHPGYARCEERLRMQRENSPDMEAIHEMRADEPDECWNMMRQSFVTNTFECIFHIPRFSAWWATCDMRPAYRRWADNLRLIGLNEPEKRWILKDPNHLYAPEALFATVPEATIVMTHRDPARSIPSVCSLNATARVVHDRVPDLELLGREQLDLWSRGIERFVAAREARPERFVDIHFHELRSDPEGVAARIFEQAGLPFEEKSRKAALEWLRGHPSSPHPYDAARFGLDEDAIRERFRSYIEAFDVRIEAR